MKLGSAIVSGAASRGVSILLRFATVPLTVSLLTREQYGLWMIISSVILWFSVSDLGIPAALQNRLVMVLHTGDSERARALVSYSWSVIAVIAVSVFAIVALLLWAVPWQDLFKIQNVHRSEFALIFLLCLGAFALGLPSRLGGVIFSAHGQLNVLPLSELVAQVSAFVMLVVAVLLQWKSLLALVACTLLSLAIVPAGLTILAFWQLHYRFRREGPLCLEDRRALLGKGGFFFLTSIGELLILQADSLLVGVVLGAASVPLFLVPAALWVNFLQLQNIFLRPLWPVLSKARAEGNAAVFSGLIRRTLFSSLAGALLFGVGLIVAGDWFVRIWSRGVASLPPLMAFGFAAYVLVASVDNLLATVLNAAGRIEQRFGYTLLFGLTKLFAGWFVLTKFGIEALPLTYALVMLTISIPFASIYVRQAIRESLPSS